MNAHVSELQQGVLQHQSGNLAAAESLYRSFLRIHPRHADALHLLGVAAHQQKRHGEAVEQIRQAIAVDSSRALYHCNLGSAYRALGEHTSAESCFRESLRLDPDFTGAYYNLGQLRAEVGRWNEAVELFHAALQHQPDYLDACNQLGLAYASLGRFELAVSAFRRAIVIQPDSAKAHYNLGNTLAATGDVPAAIHEYEAALKLAPNVPEIHNNLGVALKEVGRRDEALACFRAAVELCPEDAEAQNNLGSALHSYGDLDGAERCFRAAIAARPIFAGALTNLGNVLNDQGDPTSAIGCYSEAIAIEPASAEANFNRALARLRTGDFSNGWREYEWRWHRRVMPREFKEPTWTGAPLNGHTLLLYAEQGIGDEIQFASCVPDALERANGSRVFLECDSRLVTLFARSFPELDVVARPVSRNQRTGAVEPPVDYQIALGSLPAIFRSTLTCFPTRRQYLFAESTQVGVWRRRFRETDAMLNVGISWRGGHEEELRLRRSTLLTEWREVFSIDGVQFHSLQYGDCPGEIDAFQSASGAVLHHWPDLDRWNDLDGLAAQIAALDLVITVDNSTAHLAGALGTYVWTLLPFASDWRWMVGCDSTPWYSCMRLFRQSRPGDWDSVFAKVATSLARFRDGHAGRRTHPAERQNLN